MTAPEPTTQTEALAALIDSYAPAIQRQLACGGCESCTFCEFIEDLRTELAAHDAVVAAEAKVAGRAEGAQAVLDAVENWLDDYIMSDALAAAREAAARVEAV